MRGRGQLTGVDVHDLTVNEHYISWKWTPLVFGSLSSHHIENVRIETKHVLGVRRLEFSQTCCNINISQHKHDKTGLVIRFVQKEKNSVWSIQTMNALCSAADADQYYNEIKLYLELSTPGRPRSLLVFINPYGGKKRAEEIFYSIVRPIFNVAGIHIRDITTTRQGHCSEYMLNEDLRDYDGVVAVGGDGLFAELLQGLLYRTRADAKLPLYGDHKPFSKELSPQLKIGLIPAGSTNAVLRSMHGTEDIETAAIHIALGLDVGVDVLSVHDSDTKAFLRYTVSLLGYGFHGDILDPSEKMRWLGPPRYDVAGAIQWLKLTSYPCQITYLPSTSSTPLDENRCGVDCPVCMKMDCDEEGPSGSKAIEEPPSLYHRHDASSHPWGTEAMDIVDRLSDGEAAKAATSVASEDINGERELPGGWRVVSGDFVAVNAFLISCRCDKSPQGPAPSAHLGDGFCDLVLVRRCSRWQYLRFLAYLTQNRGRHGGGAVVGAPHLRLPFVAAHRVRAFRFQALDKRGAPVPTDETVAHDTSVWCVDGEVLRNPNVICSVNRQLIRMYGRGPGD